MADVPRPVKRRVAISKAYKTVFESPDGRLVLTDLMRVAGILEATSEHGAFENGKRAMVLTIMAELRFDENRLLELAQERMDEFAVQE